jgi:hypothetical protein
MAPPAIGTGFPAERGQHRQPIGQDEWGRRAATAAGMAGTFGNAGRNILEGPGFQSVNVSIVKNTAFTEHFTMQFRTEFFNLLDHNNFDLPDNFVGSPTFGQVVSAENPRRIQFGLKFLF